MFLFRFRCDFSECGHQLGHLGLRLAFFKSFITTADQVYEFACRCADYFVKIMSGRIDILEVGASLFHCLLDVALKDLVGAADGRDAIVCLDSICYIFEPSYGSVHTLVKLLKILWGQAGQLIHELLLRIVVSAQLVVLFAAISSDSKQDLSREGAKTLTGIVLDAFERFG